MIRERGVFGHGILELLAATKARALQIFNCIIIDYEFPRAINYIAYQFQRAKVRHCWCCKRTITLNRRVKGHALTESKSGPTPEVVRHHARCQIHQMVHTKPLYELSLCDEVANNSQQKTKKTSYLRHCPCLDN